MLSAQLHGMKELKAQLDELKLTFKVLPKAVRSAFKPVLDDAKSMVPVDSGDLRASMKLAVRRGSNPDDPIRVGIRFAANRQMAMAKAVFGGKDALPGARRWHWIELGAAGRAPHPFLRPALDKNAAGVVASLKDHIAEALAKAIKKRAAK